MQGARGGERRVSGNHAINRGPSYPDQNQAPRLPNLAIVLRSTYSYLRVQVERYGTISSIPSTIFLNALRPFITPPRHGFSVRQGFIHVGYLAGVWDGENFIHDRLVSND